MVSAARRKCRCSATARNDRRCLSSIDCPEKAPESILIHISYHRASRNHRRERLPVVRQGSLRPCGPPRYSPSGRPFIWRVARRHTVRAGQIWLEDLVWRDCRAYSTGGFQNEREVLN